MSIKRNYVKTALCDLGAGVSVMPLSLYRRLDLNKLTPTEISLQMADKSTIITDFVILDMPDEDSICIILGRPFLNTAGAVIDCNKGNVTFHVNGNGGFEFPLPTIKKKYDILIIGDVHIPVEVT